jgi:large exoprotein involved in heme utilization and adhesion
VLTTAPPEAFGFLGNKQPAEIRFKDSNLTLDNKTDNKTLSVIGGDIAITGKSFLGVTNGNIHLVSTASGGEVTMSHAGVEAPSFSRMGKIEMIGSGPSSRSRIQIGGERPGRVLIRGGQFVMENALIKYVQSVSDGDPTKNSQAIDIKLTDTMQLRTGGKIELFGQGRGLNVKTGRLEVRDGARISVNNESRTTPSTMQVEAKDVVVEGVTDDPEDIHGSEINLIGKGNIAVNTDRLEASNGGRIITSGASISVNARSITLEGVKREHRSGLIANQPDQPEDAEGTRADITIKTDRLEVKRGARISTSNNLFSTESSGNLQIEANDILVDGVGGKDKSKIITEAQAKSPTSGQGGDLKINTKNLTVSNGATISASTLGPEQGGNVFIQATNIELQNQGTISARSESKENNAGKSGNLNLTASDSLRLSGDSQITVGTNQADAGDITLDVGDLLYLSNGSSITTSVAGDTGNGGDITIGKHIAPTFVILDGSQIVAKALAGRGGKIRITSDFFFKSPDSLVSAASGNPELSGTVVIDAPDTDIIAGFAGLPANFLDAATVLTELCAGRSGANVSSLVVRKYEVLPDSPYALRVQLPRKIPTSGTAKQSRTPHTYYAGGPLPPMISCLGNG